MRKEGDEENRGKCKEMRIREKHEIEALGEKGRARAKKEAKGRRNGRRWEGKVSR